MTTATNASTLTVRYGSEHATLEPGPVAVLSVPLPLLHGNPDQMFNLPDASSAWHGPIYIQENENAVIGAAVVEVSDRMEQPINDLFSNLIDITVQRKMHLHRIWNFVPRINEFHQGLERYRQFNIGRWLAFEQRFGRDLRSYMPAASAVGVPGDSFILYFKAGHSQPLYFENPSQVPAYHYPPDYGPRPPGFARGVVVQKKHRRTAFLSGTASIEGHRSVGEGDWHSQFRTTLHNMEIMFERMEIPGALRAADPASEITREFKCYLRHPEALPLVRDWFEEQTAIAPAEVMYLQADICRSELDIEIEGTVSFRHDEVDD